MEKPRLTIVKGEGARMIPWPKDARHRGSKLHCPECARCTATKCYNGSRDHRECARHYDPSEPVPA